MSCRSPTAGSDSKDVLGPRSPSKLCWKCVHPAHPQTPQVHPSTSPSESRVPSMQRCMAAEGPGSASSQGLGGTAGTESQGLGLKLQQGRDMKPLPASQQPGPRTGNPQRRLLHFGEPPQFLHPPRTPPSVASSSSQQRNLAESGIWPAPHKCWSRTGQQCPLVATAISASAISATKSESHLGLDAGPWTPANPEDPQEPQRRMFTRPCVHHRSQCPADSSVGVTSVSPRRRTEPCCPGSTRKGHQASPRQVGPGGLPGGGGTHPAESAG